MNFNLLIITIFSIQLLVSCQQKIGAESSGQLVGANSTASGPAFSVRSGSFEYSDGTQATNCLEYRDSVEYGNEGDGTYWIDPDGAGGVSAFEADCDMLTDGGGWTLILNYLHQASTNPALDPRSSSLPLISSNTLGDDEGGDSVSWGHANNALASELTFSELKFFCSTSAHGRVMNFKTSVSSGLSYLQTGAGSFSGINTGATLLSGHTANIPSAVTNYYSGRGDLALTDFPFWRGGTYHWGVRGGGNRWECDDYAVNTADTIHRVWVR